MHWRRAGTKRLSEAEMRIRTMNASAAGARERRLAAVLAADIVGYSRLIGADELGTLRALKAMRAEFLEPMSAAYRGRIVKTTGDGLLVEFTSVVHAVACAAAIQRGGSSASNPTNQALFPLRIGVNIGDVIRDGADIFGDTVNLAARLESICEPGALTISRAVYEQVRDKLAFPFTDLGDRSLKNIRRPMRVFAISPRALALIPATEFEERPEHPPAPAAPAVLIQPRRRAKPHVVNIAGAVFALLRLSRLPQALGRLLTFPSQLHASTSSPNRARMPPRRPLALAPLLLNGARTSAGADGETEKPFTAAPRDCPQFADLEREGRVLRFPRVVND
jgi:class 3 adenylate cyclase